MLSRVTLNEYELQLKRTVQEAPPPGASLRERAATWLQRKTAEATSQEMPGAAVAKPQLKMLSELTPEEKAKPSLIGSAVKERVAAKTGLPASEVTLMLCRFDHLLASSEWFRWRRANGKPLPTNYMQVRVTRGAKRHAMTQELER
jgi:signal recognition particle GTPase